MSERAEIVVVGAGAAGLMAAIWAGREAERRGARPRIVALDGARSLGAKILVAGGGRCNVTHHEVDERAYAGSSRHAIKKVLRSFDVPRTIAFFREIGVELKREETGKLFPVTDSARTVLNTMLHESHRVNAEIRNPWRVQSVEREGTGFVVTRRSTTDEPPPTDGAAIRCERVILATGGMALPKSGSDGHGYTIARALGHSVREPIFPALVPLVLAPGCFLRELSGITLDATLEVRTGTGKRLVAFTNSTLLTHFGLSGPSVLDISRYFAEARRADHGAALVINFLPGRDAAWADAALLALGKRSPAAWLRERLPERLADALCAHAGLTAGAPAAAMPREARRALVQAVTEMPLPIVGDRGFTYAEVTAGGVPLAELHLDTMESRRCPGLHVIGEICDVDGRIGGFNFQWAWASGYLAGVACGGMGQRGAE